MDKETVKYGFPVFKWMPTDFKFFHSFEVEVKEEVRSSST